MTRLGGPAITPGAGYSFVRGVLGGTIWLFLALMG